MDDPRIPYLKLDMENCIRTKKAAEEMLENYIRVRDNAIKMMDTFQQKYLDGGDEDVCLAAFERYTFMANNANAGVESRKAVVDQAEINIISIQRTLAGIENKRIPTETSLDHD